MQASWYSKEKRTASEMLAGAKRSVDFLVPRTGATAGFLRDCVESIDPTSLKTRIIFSVDEGFNSNTPSLPEWFQPLQNQFSQCRLVGHANYLGIAIVDAYAAIVVDARDIDTGLFIQIYDRRDGNGIREFFEEVWLAAKSTTPEILHSILTLPSKPAIACITENWSTLIHRLNQAPDDLYTLGPRKFEELIAHILESKGFAVELTPATRDGGRDVLVTHSTEFGDFLYLVECKRHSRHRPVGVSLVQHLFGVLADNQANAGILITTSRFTPEALKFGERHRYQLKLRDFDNVKKWLRDYHAARPKI